jgi:hypothetical protein
MALIKVWCYFGAILSTLILFIIRKLNKTKQLDT